MDNVSDAAVLDQDTDVQGQDSATDQTNAKTDQASIGWRAALPDDLKENEVIKNYQKPGDLAKDFLKLKEEAGKKVAIPDKNASEEEVKEFRNRMGIPDKPEAYELDPKALPLGDEGAPAIVKEYSGLAHKLNLSKEQAQGVYKWYAGVEKAFVEQEKKAFEQAQEGLKKEWKGDEYNKNVNIAHRAYEQFENKEITDFMTSKKLDGVYLQDHPVMLKLFNLIGSKTLDDSAADRIGASGTTGPLTVEQIAEKMFPSSAKAKKGK